MKRLITIALTLLFVGCQKKETPINDFDHLMGKGLSMWQHVTTDADFKRLSFFENHFEKGGIDVVEEVPKTFHFIWLGPKEFPLRSQKNIESWVNHHPDWKVKFWTDRLRPLPHSRMQLEMIDKGDFSRLYAQYQASDNYAEKSDLVRYEVLLNEGGVYVDHDLFCFESIEPLLKQYHFFCGLEPPHQPIADSSISVSKNLIATIPNHPFLKDTIARVLRGWDRFTTMFPGDDIDSVIYRAFNRTFCPFEQSVMAGLDGSNLSNGVFPAAYFNKLDNQFGLYANHEYAGTWYEFEDPFEKLMKGRLMKMSKKLNKIMLITGISVAVNLLMMAGFAWMVRRKRYAQ